MTTKRKILWLLIIAVFAFIWINSLMPQKLSSNESREVMKVVKPALEKVVGKDKVTEHLVRKLGHFNEYLVLGTLLSVAFRDRVYMFIRIFMAALLTSFIDETIQIFSGRGPAVADMWIDIAGAMVGCVIVKIIYSILVKKSLGKT